MKKIIFILIIALIIFVSCIVPAPTKVKIVELSSDKAEIGIDSDFTDFFNPVELVYADSNNCSTVIVMDKNTGVLYILKESGYKWGMSPIYDSDGSVLTKEKWLARHTEKKD